jgi:hypothetical protein
MSSMCSEVLFEVVYPTYCVVNRNWKIIETRTSSKVVYWIKLKSETRVTFPAPDNLLERSWGNQFNFVLSTLNLLWLMMTRDD